MNVFCAIVGKNIPVILLLTALLKTSTAYPDLKNNTDADIFYIMGYVYDIEGAKVPGTPVYYIAGGDTLKGKTDRGGEYAIPVQLETSVSGQNSPASFSLRQNYPNPFNPSTAIRFHCSEPAAVRLDVFNILGQRVATLADGRFSRGEHTLIWNGTDDSGMSVSAGVYLYRLTAGTYQETRKMLLIDCGHVSSSSVVTSIPYHSAKTVESPKEKVYEVYCEKSGVGSIRDTVTVTFDSRFFQYDIRLPAVYVPPPYAQMEGIQYVILVYSNGEYGFRWICQFEYGDYYSYGGDIGNEEGIYSIEEDTITITIKDSDIPERIGLTFDVKILSTKSGMMQVTLSNAQVLTMGIVEEDTVSIVIMPV